MDKFQEDQRIKKYEKFQKSVNGSQGLPLPKISKTTKNPEKYEWFPRITPS